MGFGLTLQKYQHLDCFLDMARFPNSSLAGPVHHARQRTPRARYDKKLEQINHQLSHVSDQINMLIWLTQHHKSLVTKEKTCMGDVELAPAPDCTSPVASDVGQVDNVEWFYIGAPVLEMSTQTEKTVSATPIPAALDVDASVLTEG